MSMIEKAGAEQPPSFEEQMRQAEQASEMPSDEELYGEFMARPEPDPETGQTPSTSRPVEAEAEQEEQPETPEEPAAEEAVEAVAEEEKPDPLAELNKKLGQVINDNAELRKQQAEWQQQQYQQQPQQAPITQETLSYFDEYAAEDPVQAVQQAIQLQQPILYERAIRAWHEHDAVAAARFERQAELQVMQQHMQAQFQPQIQSSQALVQQRDLEQAFETVAGRHEDFAQVIGTLDEERAKQIVEGGLPAEILNGLNGDRDAKERVFETVYRWVKAEQAGVFAQASQEIAAQQAEESKQAKIDATVASATTTTPEPVEMTEEERLIQTFKELKPNLRDAWTGRSAR